MSTNNKGKTIIFILIIVFVFALVEAATIAFYQINKGKPLGAGQDLPLEQSQLLKIMRSKLVNSVIMYGKVARIQGGDIYITTDGLESVVKTNKDTKFYSIDYNPKGSAKRPSALNDIKVGDVVTTTAKVQNNYSILALSVVMYPADTSIFNK